ncbi:MAG: hypothetical protein KTR31_03895 [Myxococcales bacterium]|nr:hypothetical protein [Myxococcales bacterium]
MNVATLIVVMACTDGSSRASTEPPDPSPSSPSSTTPTAPDPPSRRTLVVPEARGLTLVDLDEMEPTLTPWTEWMPDCNECGGEGASADGDGLLVSLVGKDGEAIARLDADGLLDFRVDGFRFPHDVMRDPADDTLMVVETFADRVTWIDGAGTSALPVRTLGKEHPRFPPLPNGADRFEHDGRSLLLLSHLGVGGGPGSITGVITLWDITAPSDAQHLWTFPQDGQLQTPHGPVLRMMDDVWWLLWAHTYGDGERGTVGLARTDDPLHRPTYVADLVPGDDVGSFEFLRGVELDTDGTLWLTDSGTGWITRASWPTPPPRASGATGGVGDQRYEELGEAEIVLDNLFDPFEAWLWTGFPE